MSEAKTGSVGKKSSHLSKSLFITGRQCPKALWLSRYRPELKEIDPGQQRVLSSGTSVGVLAQQLFPGGVEIPFEGATAEQQLELTRKAMAEGARVIYEAAFRFDGVFMKGDILVKAGSYWHLYEVKSSTGMKDVYLDDIALLLAITETPPFCDMWWRPILSHGHTCALSHLREAAGPHWRMVFRRTIPIA